MRTFLVTALAAQLFVACSCNQPPEIEVANETVNEVVVQLKEEQERADASGTLDSLPEDQVIAILEKREERISKISELANASPHKDKSDAEIEAMIEALLKEYEGSPSKELEQQIITTMRDPVVKMFYDKEQNMPKRDAIVKRLKQVKASGTATE